MIESRTQCIHCDHVGLQRFHTYWECPACGYRYPCVEGIPRLYAESDIGEADRQLRDRLYTNILSRFYGFTMPFLSIPVRPIRMSLLHWGVYGLMVCWFVLLFWRTGQWLLIRRLQPITTLDVLAAILLVASVALIRRYPYVWKLLVLAIPTKISLSLHPFRAAKSFREVHAEFQKEFRDKPETLHMLDIATGSCNSLFRHGWMKLNARYVGVDLSETMLLQGARFMAAHGIPIDFAFADAHRLPFEAETFDIVTCYGALNGFTSPRKALAEMARVTKDGGRILFLDEQLYENASLVERAYSDGVLAGHNTINRCPVEAMPAEFEDVQVYQVYQFYYICTARRRARAASAAGDAGEPMPLQLEAVG